MPTIDSSTITPTTTPYTPMYSGLPTPMPTWTLSPTPKPTLTPLPFAIMGDIHEISKDNANTIVNQYGWYAKGFEYEISSDPDCIHNGQFGLKIKTKTINEREAFWAISYTPPLDGTKIKYLTFWVKGKTGNEVIYVWITINYGEEFGSYSNEFAEISKTEWRQIKIPLPNERRSMYQIPVFSLILESDNGAESVCVDDISFTP